MSIKLANRTLLSENLNNCFELYPAIITFVPVIGQINLNTLQMDNSNGTRKQLKQEDLQPIIDHIERYYEGNVLILTEWLDRAIYMFHYVPCDGEFTELQKQNVCGVIRKV